MSAILNSLNAHYLPIFQPILMILVSKFMVYRSLADKTYLSLGLLSPLTLQKVAYDMDTMQRSACLVVNPITVYSCGFHLNA